MEKIVVFFRVSLRKYDNVVKSEVIKSEKDEENKKKLVIVRVNLYNVIIFKIVVFFILIEKSKRLSIFFVFNFEFDDSV